MDSFQEEFETFDDDGIIEGDFNNFSHFDYAGVKNLNSPNVVTGGRADFYVGQKNAEQLATLFSRAAKKHREKALKFERRFKIALAVSVITGIIAIGQFCLILYFIGWI